MPSEPQIRMMSYRRRTWFFKALFLVFIIALPIFIFYTTGYRLSFQTEGTMVVTTGGVYITTENLEVDVYLDDKQVQSPRLFRSAYYIQNIESGNHSIVVQQPGLHTWVKQLPVDPYIVIEAAAFNMPVLPHIRPISQYVNELGQDVFFAESSTTELFPKATTTEDYLVLTRRGTTTLSESSEYEFVFDLFNSTSTNRSLLERVGTQIERFAFATTTETGEATTTIEYIEKGDIRLVEKESDLYAVWAGSPNNVPHYFCVNEAASTTVASRYGEHVAQQIEEQRLSTSTPLIYDGNRICRTQIKLDRKWMEVKMYNFLPNSNDLIVLQLEDGLYVGEIDDRAWQNTQQIYPGTDFETLVTDDAIYIREDGIFIELLTEIEIE